MVNGGNSARLLRARGTHDQQVTPLELFFDLVYVFAVTQLSQQLLHHLSVVGALQTVLLLVAVWRAWMDAAWLTNWFDPDHRVVRLVLVSMGLASLLMSVALPEAFGERGLVFAGASVTMQVGRNLFAVAALRQEPGLRRNFQRLLAWSVGTGALWLIGGVVDDTARGGGVAGGSRDGRSRACARVLHPWTGTVAHNRLDDQRRPSGRALPTVHHPGARRVDPSYRHHVRCIVGIYGDADRLCDRLPEQRGPMVGLFRPHRRVS